MEKTFFPHKEVTYKVVVNHEQQYSLWRTQKRNALGWRDVGVCGTKEECLAFIREVWTDMRPLSLQRVMSMPVVEMSIPARATA